MTNRSIPHARRLVRSSLAALWLALLGPGTIPVAAALSCPELQDRLEKQFKAKGTDHPPLRIVPKNLVGKARVLGSCENDSQRIVWRDEPAASPASNAASAGRK